MLGVVSSIKILAGDRQADRIVPPTGFTARLTLFTAAAMAFFGAAGNPLGRRARAEFHGTDLGTIRSTGISD